MSQSIPTETIPSILSTKSVVEQPPINSTGTAATIPAVVGPTTITEDLEAMAEEEQKRNSKCKWPSVDEWKRLYLNNDTREEALKQLLDPEPKFFVWKAVLTQPEELVSLGESYKIRNRVNGMFAYSEAGKFAFAQSQIVYPPEDDDDEKAAETTSTSAMIEPVSLTIYWIFKAPEDVSLLLGDNEVYTSFTFTRVALDSTVELNETILFLKRNLNAKHPMLRA